MLFFASVPSLLLTSHRKSSRCSGGSGGRKPACAPLSTQILSFLHTNFLQCCRVGPWRSPYGDGAPLREILDPSLRWLLNFCFTVVKLILTFLWNLYNQKSLLIMTPAIIS